MLTMANKKDKIEAVTAEISKVVQDSLASILKQTFGKVGLVPTSSNAGTSGTRSASALEISEDELRIVQKSKQMSHLRTSKAHSKLSTKKTKSLTIGVCKMERSRLRGLKKASDYVEVTFSPDDDYLACVYKAVDVLGWKYDPSDGAPYLCRLNGCRIVNQTLISGSWTIGAYVKSVFKSTNNIKLGVALLEEESYDSCGDHTPPPKRPRTSVSSVQVMYAPSINIGVDIAMVVSREDAWRKLKHSSCDLINSPLPWYPEQSDYVVCSIKQGGKVILDYTEREGFVVDNNKSTGKLSVTNQTEQAVIPAPGQVVPLFCVASNHSLHYKYEWTSLTGVVGMNSPVYYANKPGVYRCTVTAGDRLDQTCLSRSVNVIEADAMTGVTDALHNSTNSKCSPNTSITDSVENSGHMSTFRSIVPHSSHGHTTENQDDPELPSWVREFTDMEIIEATSTTIGKGGFGRVYRGTCHGTDIAVKVLSEESGKMWSSLPREVVNLTRFQHPYLISLMGFCRNPSSLVYPYMPNLSLYHCLHEFKVDNPLTWPQRRVGTAKGLAYLHSSTPTFVHQDVKSHNILLDEAFAPKLADFGFVTPLPQNVGSTLLVTVAGTTGTRGYLPPEHCDGKRGVKSDVYSYGIVCLETFTGRLAYAEFREECKLYDHCKDELELWKDEDTFKSGADTKMKAVQLPDLVVRGFKEVSEKCTHKNYKKRCNMDEVIRIWNASAEY